MFPQQGSAFSVSCPAKESRITASVVPGVQEQVAPLDVTVHVVPADELPPPDTTKHVPPAQAADAGAAHAQASSASAAIANAHIIAGHR